ncbi:hypothetical protein PFBG_06129 [Plasmodium falciparum 7G8]|uniref:Uncharacterized protein n=1 Tax=Plasmodium falciparum (isolate 7G8) TaxID=57266 RepID=W7ESJ1_PLAF8|nr:hypothetical protein PFBG_06129 [Plasmodium falciparum 7G8]
MEVTKSIEKCKCEKYENLNGRYQKIEIVHGHMHFDLRIRMPLCIYICWRNTYAFIYMIDNIDREKQKKIFASVVISKIYI